MLDKATGYAEFLGASSEVLDWTNTIIRAREKKGKTTDLTEFEHILDYLVSDKAPKRLRKMSYEQAKSGADKWTAANMKRGKGLEDGAEDIEEIIPFEDGTRIVKLVTKKAYEREGHLMSHCLGGYDPEGQTTMYSYRDKNNMPHATFEVDKDDGEVMQIKGKGNGAIHPKYIEPILSFLDHLGMEVRTYEMRNLGYMHVTKETKELLSRFVDANGKSCKIHEIRGAEYVVA